MDLRWTGRAQGDLTRLHAFLDPMNPAAAARVMQRLTAAPVRLLTHPRLGERLEEFNPREVRRLFIGPYELRYELREAAIIVLRVWHGREDR